MTTLAQATTTLNLTVQDWLGLVGLMLAQTMVLGGVLWRFASRMQKLETNVDNLTNQVVEDLGARVTRMENLSFRP